jgi:toxin ParE1/3/4
MSRSVSLTFAAARDLEEIIDYIASHDAPERAEYVLAQMERAFDSLSESSACGARPGELVALGIREYREIFFKPYRIIYRIDGEAVTILLIADGRRDMQTLLQRRLLEA